MSFDLTTLPVHFSDRLPRRWIAGVLFFAAAFLTLAWLGCIAPTITQQQLPPLENTTSLFIQAMDLAIIVPLCVLSGILLLLLNLVMAFLLLRNLGEHNDSLV
jgi:hypothetical protein